MPVESAVGLGTDASPGAGLFARQGAAALHLSTSFSGMLTPPPPQDFLLQVQYGCA